jgi:hypothetical protein
MSTVARVRRSRVIAAVLGVAAIAAAVLAVASCGGDDDEPESKTVSVLFVQSAPQGTLERIQGKPHRFALTLKRIPPDLVWFSDRPHRRFGHVPVAAFVDHWKTAGAGDSFRADPPNASLSLSARQRAFVIELSDPVYSRKAGTLRYHVRGEDIEGGRAPARFRDAFLFVDDFPVTPGPGNSPMWINHYTPIFNPDTTDPNDP